MNHDRSSAADPRIETAIAELTALILARYPDARLGTYRGEDPNGLYLRATVDLEDTEEVLEAVLDKVYEIQVERALPVHVVTTLPWERVAEQLGTRTNDTSERSVSLRHSVRE